MSEETKNNLAAEKERTVVVTPDDAKSAFDFWPQFDVPLMPGLKEAFEAFQANPTYENQQRMKLKLCKAISTTNHACFVDETFSKVTEECADVSYDMEFDEEFEKTLAEAQATTPPKSEENT